MGTPAITAAQRRYRDRANRLSRALLSEKRRSGYLSDGSGRRYRIGPLYALAGDIEKALKHYEWFDQHCTDDIGEPFHYLWWALTLYRAGNLEDANDRLLETMVRNLYLLPHLIGLALARQDMWHSSNWDQPEYISQVSDEFLPQLSEDERQWIQQQLESPLFRRVKEEYVATHHALLGEDDIGKRAAILRRWDSFWSSATC